MRDYTTIPAHLCQYAVLSRKVNELKLYIYLKLNSNGFVGIDDKAHDKWAEDIGVNKKTITKCLEWLIKRKWITVNSKRNSLKICGYAKIKSLLNIDRTTYAIFEPTSINDYQIFRAFCCGVIMKYNLGKKKYFDKQRSAVKNGTSTLNRLCKKGFYPMPNNYLAKCLEVSLSTAFRIKNEAEKFGFIETKSSRDTVDDDYGNPLPVQSIHVIKTVFAQDGLPNTLRRGKKRLLTVVSDLIRCSVITKRRRMRKK